MYLNEYKTKKRIRKFDKIQLDFILMLYFKELKDNTFDNTDNGDKKVERNSHGKYFLPRMNKTNLNLLIDDRNFMINQLMIKL